MLRVVQVSLSLAFTILFTFYLDQNCAPVHRKNTEVLPYFFPCSYSQLYPCTRPLISDWRSQVSILTRVILLATCHCLDTCHVILHHRANSNLSLISHSPQDSGACVRTKAQCQGTGLLLPECKSHPWLT